MKGKFKLGALAWGIAAVVAFPAGAAAADNSAECTQLATGNTTAPDQCYQTNSADNSQTTTTYGGDGGSASGGYSAPADAVGDGAHATSEGGDAKANGGDAKSKNAVDNDQSNQISGRDSATDDPSGSDGGNNASVCKQQAGGNTSSPNQCYESNDATNTQTTTTYGGDGGSEISGGTSGPAEAEGDGAHASSEGGSAYANGGDAKSKNAVDNDQSNQISGRDSSGGDPDSDGNNNGAVCSQLATGNTAAPNQCYQTNDATNTQTTTTYGGNGGSASGGYSGPALAVGDGAHATSEGGSAYANGGDAKSYNSLDNDQSNQISGRDSSGGDPDSNGVYGGSNGAVCSQLATGNTTAPNQCYQTNSATNSQTTTTYGGAGGSAFGGTSGPALAVGDGAHASSQGGDAKANGGDAKSYNSLENRQSNQISGRDSIGDYATIITYHKEETKKTEPPAVTVVVVYQPAPTATTPTSSKAKVKAAVKKSKKRAKKSKKRSKGKVKAKNQAVPCLGC